MNNLQNSIRTCSKLHFIIIVHLFEMCGERKTSKITKWAIKKNWKKHHNLNEHIEEITSITKKKFH